MTPRKGFVKFLKVPEVSDPLKQIHTHAAGIDETTALVLLSETGPDLSAFATEKHFGSGGKVRKRRVKPSASRANRAFRLAASGCHHAKNALGAFYRRQGAGGNGPQDRCALLPSAHHQEGVRPSRPK